MSEIHVVTGAFGYSGKYIAKKLLAAGQTVWTLTNSLQRRNPFGDQVKAYPYHFDEPSKLAEVLAGVKVLYNTYWVRFNHKQQFTHSVAVENTLKLFAAAKEAGVKRLVHVSITNPVENSPLEYFSGKAKLEKALSESGLSYAILRPAVIFGDEDILINNIAWFLRNFPVFGVFGRGNYRLQPIFVEDMAGLAVEQGQKTDNCIINAIGPETFTYRELVRVIGKIIGKPRAIMAMPPSLGYLVGAVIGKLKGDVTITREEIKGLMDDLLYVDAPPAGQTRLTDWVKAHATTVGIHYSSELARRINRTESYERL
jgi:NADH dehydrogenase